MLAAVFPTRGCAEQSAPFGTIAVVAIIIDAPASIVRPDDADVRAWMADQRVFISSVMAGMTDLRHTLADAIADAGAEPVYFETFGGRSDDAEAAYLGEVAASTIYLGVLGQSYGRLQPSRLSATHEEFREADRLNLSVSVWVQRGVEMDGDQVKFLDEVRLFHTTGTFQGADDLCASVVRRLNEIAAADLSPWVLLGGELMFRARSIRDDGQRITIESTIRNPALASALEIHARLPGPGKKDGLHSTDDRRLSQSSRYTPRQ